jgi:saccharopine dehydrogenase-like NADP-dependent oxidoreductase
MQWENQIGDMPQNFLDGKEIDRAFKIVILGATGSLGRCVVEFFIHNQLEVAVVSRSNDKLAEMELHIQENLRKHVAIHKLELDINVGGVLHELCENTYLLINCLPSVALCENVLQGKN